MNDYRYDYVLTRHPITQFSELDRYTIKNEITITLTPSDQIDDSTTVSSSRLFSWERPHFVYPTGHFNVYKRGDGSYRRNNSTGMQNGLGLVRGNYTRYDLDKLKEDHVSSLDNFDYGA
jgi:hypothetical protein